ncbi:GDP-L-fucose synthase family protein [Sulfuriferula sp.]|uniref:GDP-L-fucose synthase family protein n=1 Tax=Sulfuriferula sp. TaxID=2025307 RepID=UPI00352223AA
MISSEAPIFVAGHRGMVGSALIRRLAAGGYRNIITAGRDELDLLDQAAVRAFMDRERPAWVIVAAAKVGGIHANNTFRADFLYENLVIETNLIQAAHAADVNQLLFLGSSCIYPRDCPQPIREDYLLTGPLEATNEPYAIAKIAGVKLCEAFAAQYGRRYFSIMPTNLYGPNDNYDLQTSHVLPALLRKTHEAMVRNDSAVTVWGTGSPRREFLHVDDLAEACLFLMERDYQGQLLNVGVGEDVTIRELAQTIADVVGFRGQLQFDATKPDGTPRKLLDVSRMKALGWAAGIGLKEGLAQTYADFKSAPRRGTGAEVLGEPNPSLEPGSFSSTEES